MTEKTIIPEFEQVTQALSRVGSLSDPAEAHGMLCGMLCADGATGSDVWLEQIMSDAPGGYRLVGEGNNRDILLELFAATAHQLEGAGLDFAPLLPDDEVSLSERVDLLGHWCQGFMFGLGVSGIEKTRKMPDEVREFLDDLAAISQAGFDADEAGNEDEQAYTEIVEYVRVGVLLINEVLQPRPPQNNDPYRLH